jgi:hypothetical protein
MGASGFFAKNLARSSQSVETGHVEIHDGEVGIGGAMLLDGFFAIGCFTANLPVVLGFDQTA